jgi:hypothetical protein
MKKNLLLSMACFATFCCAAASAQSAPLRGVGLLALGASEPGSGALLDMADAGGGSIGSRALRGGDGADRALPTPTREAATDDGDAPDALPPAAIPQGDPTVPAAPTPKRPTYRWQSLVPGAIK